MRALVSGTIGFHGAECHPKALERLRRELSFPNPEYVSRRRMRRKVAGIDERIECLMERQDGWVKIPRGAVGLLRKHVAKVGAHVDFEDQRSFHPSAGLHAEAALRPYQAEAVDKMRRGIQGTVVMPCGGGKTITGTAAIAVIDQPTLVLVHTHDLLEQWRETVRRVLKVNAGVIAEGTCEPSTVTVATVQTLTRLPPNRLETLGPLFGCVMVDEAHHAPASTFQSVLSRMPARYRFGLTATPNREDGLTSLLELTLGDRLFEISYADLVEMGYLDSPKACPIYSTFAFDYTGPRDYHACMSALVADQNRNELIADLAVREAANGHNVLVLSSRVAHCRLLAEMIRRSGVHADVLVGAVKKPERRRILEQFREGYLAVLVASTLADEGLDVPRLDRIILAFPGRTKGRTAQRIGRLMRPHPEKSGAELFDIVDAGVPPLLRQYRERRRIYERLIA